MCQIGIGCRRLRFHTDFYSLREFLISLFHVIRSATAVFLVIHFSQEYKKNIYYIHYDYEFFIDRSHIELSWLGLFHFNRLGINYSLNYKHQKLMLKIKI